jgi:hypothetical protein
MKEPPMRVQLFGKQELGSLGHFDVLVEEETPEAFPESPWVLKLQIHSAKGIPEGPFGASRDCYVLVKFEDMVRIDAHTMPGFEMNFTQGFKTEKRLNTLEAHWEPPHEFCIGINDPQTQFVVISLYDWDRLWEDVPLGDRKIAVKVSCLLCSCSHNSRAQDFMSQRNVEMPLRLVTPLTGAASSAEVTNVFLLCCTPEFCAEDFLSAVRFSDCSERSAFDNAAERTGDHGSRV